MDTPQVRSATDMLIELVFWCGVWQFIFAGLLRNIIEKYVTNKPWFSNALKRGGVLAKNAGDDVILLMVLVAHHTFAAMVMIAGYVLESPSMFAHGLLVECGFEFTDLVAILFGLWPHANKSMRPEMKVAFIFHHLPALLLTIPLVQSELTHSKHLMKIGIDLLLAAGISAGLGTSIQLCDFDTQMKQAAGIQVFTTGIMAFTRGYLFPLFAFDFLEELEAHKKSETNLILACKAGVGIMSLFNIILVLALIEKSIRYVRRAFFNPKLNIEDGPVAKPAYDYAAKYNKKSQ